MIHDLSWSEKAVLLKINRRQFKCNNCKKVFSEKLNFVDKSKGYTKRLAIDIVDQVLDSNIQCLCDCFASLAMTFHKRSTEHDITSSNFCILGFAESRA